MGAGNSGPLPTWSEIMEFCGATLARLTSLITTDYKSQPQPCGPWKPGAGGYIYIFSNSVYTEGVLADFLRG